MDPKTTPASPPESTVADPPTESPEAPKAAPSNGAVMDVVAPPPQDKADQSAPDNAPGTASQAEHKAAETPKVVKPKSPRDPNVTTAIIATVLIVIVLAALATFAFLQKK